MQVRSAATLKNSNPFAIVLAINEGASDRGTDGRECDLHRYLLIAVLAGTLFATAGAAEEAKKIQDNSFLLEEAYNQEEGVIHHIQSYYYNRQTRDWLYIFTQEWPAPKQAHQLSYTIPYVHYREGDVTGFGDVALNYRYQLAMKDHLAIAPRFSLIMPSGDYKKGLGAGTIGYQVNLPVSIEFGEQWVTHGNAGASYNPRAKEAEGGRANTWGYNMGASLIWLATATFNAMTEVVWTSTEIVLLGGSKKTEQSIIINPGVRFAKNYPSGLQIVPGLSFPIEISKSRSEYGALLYLAFEHPLF